MPEDICVGMVALVLEDARGLPMLGGEFELCPNKENERDKILHQQAKALQKSSDLHVLWRMADEISLGVRGTSERELIRY